MPVAQLTHDSKIDWLELNETGTKLLLRDKKMRLSLLDTSKAIKLAILNFCTFVQVNFACTFLIYDISPFKFMTSHLLIYKI